MSRSDDWLANRENEKLVTVGQVIEVLENGMAVAGWTLAFTIEQIKALPAAGRKTGPESR